MLVLLPLFFLSVAANLYMYGVIQSLQDLLEQKDGLIHRLTVAKNSWKEEYGRLEKRYNSVKRGRTR